jgi:hypothetical protein
MHSVDLEVLRAHRDFRIAIPVDEFESRIERNSEHSGIAFREIGNDEQFRPSDVCSDADDTIGRFARNGGGFLA